MQTETHFFNSWRGISLFCFLRCILFFCDLSIAMKSSRASATKRMDRRVIGTECHGCHHMFATKYAYDQHRRSRHLRGTACYAFPDEKRVNVTAVSRANMSTALVERRAAKRTRGAAPNLHILHIMSVSAYIC